MNSAKFTTLLFAALACLVSGEETTTNWPDASTTSDYNGTTLFDESTTVMDFQTTEASVELSTTASDRSVDTTTYKDATEKPTDVAPTVRDQWMTTTFLDDVYSNQETTTILDESTATEINEKLNTLEDFNSETSKEKKPVVEPLFIKKYWPLLCLKTKCGIRLASSTIPHHEAEEVRTDLEESRSSGEVLRGILDDMIIDSDTKQSDDSSLNQS